MGLALKVLNLRWKKYQGTLLLDDTENQFTAVASVIEQSSFKIQEKEASEEIEEQKSEASEIEAMRFDQYETIMGIQGICCRRSL